MGDRFRWQFDESVDARSPSDNARQSLYPVRKFWITVALITLFVIGGWAFLRHRQDRVTQTLIAAAQSTLQRMAAAVLDGDGEVFFAFHDQEPETIAAQLSTPNLNFYRAEPVITDVEQAGDLLRANAVWRENGQIYQRVLFFARQGYRLQHTASDPDFWGEEKTMILSWGRLNYLERDEGWAGEIAQFVTAEIKKLCNVSCLADRLPLTLTIGAGFLPTAEPGHIQIASPRLLGLDQSGRPSDRFWNTLAQQLVDTLTPATIRFAVPPESKAEIESRFWQRFDYQAAADAFMAEHPEIRVELVPFESFPAEPITLLSYDGAAVSPTIEMIAGGRVVDLTPYMLSDPEFDRANFYEQLWQGAAWQERLWMMPQAAMMPLIFYHRSAYRSLEREEPIIGWTWADMEEDAAALVGAQIVTGDSLAWGMLDQTFNILFAYAFNHQSQCTVFDGHRCLSPLTIDDIAASLEWYRKLTVDEKIMADPSALPIDTRERLLINSVFKTGLWVDEPLYYEHHTSMFPMGIVPFPGSERLDSSTPLWVMGSFISQESARPLATWQWLKFLSRWPPMAHYRLVPARISATQKVDFWNTLPREIAEPMRAAFPLARAVSLDERAVFSWPAVRALAEGELTPYQAAQQGRDFSWFGE